MIHLKQSEDCFHYNFQQAIDIYSLDYCYDNNTSLYILHPKDTHDSLLWPLESAFNSVLREVITDVYISVHICLMNECHFYGNPELQNSQNYYEVKEFNVERYMHLPETWYRIYLNQSSFNYFDASVVYGICSTIKRLVQEGK